VRVDLGDPLVTERLGPGWYQPEPGIRWMGRTASLRMPGPRTANQRLYVTAICPAAQLENGALEVTVSVDGVRLPPARFTRGNPESTLVFGLPPQAVGKSEILIALEVSRTVRIGADQRELGLAVRQIEIK
jgi:hypothetical protein